MKMSNMLTALFATLIIMVGCNQLNAQIMYKVDDEYDADLKVYVTEYKSQADVVVYVTERQEKAKGDRGIWYFTEWKSEADKKVYFTDWKGEADLIIFYTDWEAEAGKR